MKNNRINTKMRICDIILSMNHPFIIPQLFDETDKCGITNRDLVLDILGQLCESGIIKYSEVEDDVWAYKKV